MGGQLCDCAGGAIARESHAGFGSDEDIKAETTILRKRGGVEQYVGNRQIVARALQALDATPPRLYLLTIEAAQRVAFAPGLSPAVAAAVGPAAEHVRRHLEKSS